MRRILGIVFIVSLVAVLVAGSAIGASGPQAISIGKGITLKEFRVPESSMAQLKSEFIDRTLANYPEGSWAPLKMELDDHDLALMGLPSRQVLLSSRYPVPTMVSRSGKKTPVSLPPISQTEGTLGPTVATYAGAGWLGIRPGAWLLLLEGGSIGWCSMAHVYGGAGSYQVSTAGHCGKVGDIGTVIAGFGQHNGLLDPILLDFGQFSHSTGDAGLGKDWALISVYSQFQNLVTPTMAEWGGPRGIFTKQGQLVTLGASTGGRNIVTVKPSVTPDPFLAQTIVHYGHGAGVGTGGTGRAGEAIAWLSGHFMFFGAISPGDSGSGANTVVGDAAKTMEAAGIMTHLYVDPLMRSGLGIMGGTRATLVGAAIANGQLIPYPVPAPGLP